MLIRTRLVLSRKLNRTGCSKRLALCLDDRRHGLEVGLQRFGFLSAALVLKLLQRLTCPLTLSLGSFERDIKGVACSLTSSFFST